MAEQNVYWMKKGESADAYNKRISEYRASPEYQNTTEYKAGQAGQSGQQALTDQITKALANQSSAITSSTTNLEGRINAAIGSVRQGTQAETQRIQSEFGRELGYAQGQAQSEFQNFAESRTGFGTQMTAFRELVKTTDKYMSDLTQRKEEMILANNAAGASKIADLEMKALEYQQQAQQQVFDNILKTGAFSLQVAAEQRAGAEFTASLALENKRFDLDKIRLDRDTESKMAELATAYGVSIEPGDTLASVVKKVQPQASAEARARLSKLVAETNRLYETNNKQKLEANFRLRISELMANGITDEKGNKRMLSPSEAALYAIDELTARKIDLSQEDVSNAMAWAQEADQALKADKQRILNESASTLSILGDTNVFRGGTKGGGGGFSLGDWFTTTVLGETPDKSRRRYNELNNKFGKLSPAELQEWKTLDAKFK